VRVEIRQGLRSREELEWVEAELATGSWIRGGEPGRSFAVRINPATSQAMLTLHPDLSHLGPALAETFGDALAVELKAIKRLQR
jgi:hypothetical protein